MKKVLNVLLTAAVIAAALMLFSACAGCVSREAGRGDDDSLQKIIDAGQFVLGLDQNFPPMGFLDESGTITGFDIDVAGEVCKRLGVKLVLKPIDWDEKEDELNSGKIDCIWNGLSVTPDREQSMNLSDPYMKNELIFIVLEDSDAKGLRDLAGKTVGVQSGSTGEEELERSSIYPDIKAKRYDTALEVIDRLNAGEIDVALIDSVLSYYCIFSSETQYYILSESLAEEEYAIGFRKNDQKLRDRIQEIISEMKADGTLGQISKKWFESDITIVK